MQIGPAGTCLLSKVCEHEAAMFQAKLCASSSFVLQWKTRSVVQKQSHLKNTTTDSPLELL